MSKSIILKRLHAGHPGWSEWTELLSFVDSLQFKAISDEFLGKFFASDSRLVFRELPNDLAWPAWMPSFVPALLGMKADEYEMSGGYGEDFDGNTAQNGAVFSPAGNDELLGFPLIDVPAGIYRFQSNSSGASFFIDKRLNVFYPNSIYRRFEILDSLEDFTKTSIRQVINGAQWFDAYCDKIKGDILD